LKVILLAVLCLVPLFVNDAYSHGVTCGLSCKVGGHPAIPQPDSDVLRFLSGYQQLIFFGAIFAVSVLIYYAFSKSGEIHVKA